MSTAVGVFEQDSVDLAEVGRSKLFQKLDLTGLGALVRTCPALPLAAGATLIAPGQPNHVLYLVLSGRLNVYHDEPGDNPVGEIREGECVGLSSLIDRRPCRLRVTAAEPCRLLAVDEERLLALIDASDAVARNAFLLLRHYARGLGAAECGRPPRVERDGNIDAVTGVYNQRWLDGKLDRQIMRAATDGKPLSVLAIDVNGFTQFNEEFGRELGDHALASVARVIGASVRPTDMLARHESNRFLVVLPETDGPGAEAVASRIREAVAGTEIEIPDACRLPPLTVSTGHVQMKAFVAGRKLVDDALAALTTDATAALPEAAAG